MTAANPLVRLNAHRAWANALYVEWMTAHETGLSSPDGEYCIKMFSHVLRVEDVWLGRLRGESPGNTVWNALPVQEMDALRSSNDIGLAAAVGLDPGKVFHFNRFDGAPMESTAADILTQVCMHGMYHRGQLAARAAQAGLPKLPGTDFILFSRQSP